VKFLTLEKLKNYSYRLDCDNVSICDVTWKTYEFNTKVHFSVHIVTALVSTVLVLETEFIHFVSKGSRSCCVVKRIQQL